MFGKANYFLSPGSEGSRGGAMGSSPQVQSQTYGPYGHAVKPAALSRRALPPWWPDNVRSNATSAAGPAATAASAAPSSAAGRQQISRRQRQLQRKQGEEYARQLQLEQERRQQQLERDQRQQQLERDQRQQQLERDQRQQLERQRRQQQQQQRQHQLEQQRQHQLEQQRQHQLEQQRQQQLEQQRQLQLEQQRQQQAKQQWLQQQQQQEDHRRQSHSCTLCGLQFPSAPELQVHKLESSEHRSNQKMLICREECQRVYGVANDHRLMQFLLHFCHTCCMAFENESQLQRHIASAVHKAAAAAPPMPSPTQAADRSAAVFPPPAAGAGFTAADSLRPGRQSGGGGDLRSLIAASGPNSLFGKRPAPVNSSGDGKETPGVSAASRKNFRKIATSKRRSNVDTQTSIVAARSSSDAPARSRTPPPSAPPLPPTFRAKAVPERKAPQSAGNSLLGSTSAPGPKGKKRPAAASAVSPHPEKQSSGGPVTSFCSLCSVYLNSDISRRDHYAGKKHAATLEKAGADAAAAAIEKSSLEDAGFVHCEICQVPVRRSELADHRASVEHTRELVKIGDSMMKLMGR